MPNPGLKNKNYSRLVSGTKNPRWNSGLLSYSGIHIWLRTKYGRANKCEHCGSVHKITWANVKHEPKTSKFERIREDWIQLCYPCHKKFDGHIGPMKEWGT